MPEYCLEDIPTKSIPALLEIFSLDGATGQVK